jgi:hypothetical protein
VIRFISLCLQIRCHPYRQRSTRAQALLALFKSPGRMGDTDGMKRPSRLRQPRLRLRDWIGDGVLTLVAGTVLLAAVFLPWVNENAPGLVNFSFQGAREFNGVLQTRWGWPALGLAVAVLVAGAVMVLTRPRRVSIYLGALVAALGVAVFGVAQDAAAHIGFSDPGVGMYLTTLVGVLLVPIGIAAALVALILVRVERRASEEPPGPTAPSVTAPPAPENAPPT